MNKLPKYVRPSVIADLLGCSLTSVTNLKNKMDVNDAGEYEMQSTMRHLYQNKRVSGDLLDPDAAKRKLKAEADLAEYKAKEAERQELIKEGELRYSRDVTKVWSSVFREVKQRCFEYLKECMDLADLKPMDRERKQNEFADFFNSLTERGK